MGYRKAAIRTYRPDDEPLLFGLARASFGEHGGWSDERTLAVLGTETVYVAEVGGELAGYVAVEREGDALRIDQLLVGPGHEGEGVGHQLLDWAEGLAIAERARVLRIAVEPDNVRALDFYRRSGFTQAGPGVLELILPQD
jgi:ribosomal protein S18 acetylase RimI-like enzyme